MGTSAWVTTPQALFADRLLNLDLKVIEHEFYLSILTQRIRAMFAAQIPKDGGSGDSRTVRQNHEQILRVLICGANDVDDSKEKENADESNAIVFDRDQFATEWTRTVAVPATEPLEQEQYDEFDVCVCSPSTKRLIAAVVSRIDIRDLLQSFAFFDVLAKLGPNAFDENAYESDAFRAFSSHEFAHSERTPNDFNSLWRAMGCEVDMTQTLRAICAVSVLCHSNRLWQDNAHWFCDDRLKQLFNDPDSVLAHIHANFLRSQIRRKPQSVCPAVRGGGSFSDSRSQKQIHKGLPDGVDEFGNLPQLRCAYSGCGMEFASREEMIAHVKQSRGGHLTRKFHKNCRSVLEPNPGMSFYDFKMAAKNLWTRAHPAKVLLRAYYDQMQPIFMRNRK